MPFYEREEELMKIISSEKNISGKEIARRLFISLPTLRRDLIKLEKRGL